MYTGCFVSDFSHIDLKKMYLKCEFLHSQRLKWQHLQSLSITPYWYCYSTVGGYTAGFLKHNSEIAILKIIKSHYHSLRSASTNIQSIVLYSPQHKIMNTVNYSDKKLGKLGNSFLSWNLNKVAWGDQMAFAKLGFSCICKHWIKRDILQLWNQWSR